VFRGDMKPVHPSLKHAARCSTGHAALQ
jgi:hypothetical protein